MLRWALQRSGVANGAVTASFLTMCAGANERLGREGRERREICRSRRSRTERKRDDCETCAARQTSERLRRCPRMGRHRVSGEVLARRRDQEGVVPLVEQFSVSSHQTRSLAGTEILDCRSPSPSSVISLASRLSLSIFISSPPSTARASLDTRALRRDLTHTRRSHTRLVVTRSLSRELTGISTSSSLRSSTAASRVASSRSPRPSRTTGRVSRQTPILLSRLGKDRRHFFFSRHLRLGILLSCTHRIAHHARRQVLRFRR